MPDQLKPVDVHECALYLMEWFEDVSTARNYTEFGPLPLSYTEIKAWSELTATPLTAWEVATLKKIDLVYVSEAIKKK